MSALRASRFLAVSLRVSPFFSDDASAVKLMISAVNRSAASSKLIRVRVEGSMNKLTTVFPRSAGTFLIARSPTALKALAVSRTVTISSALNDWISSRCFRVQIIDLPAGSLPENYRKMQTLAFGGGALKQNSSPERGAANVRGDRAL